MDGFLLLQVIVIRDQKIVHTESVDFEPNAVALHPSGALVAVGSNRVSMLSTLVVIQETWLLSRGAAWLKYGRYLYAAYCSDFLYPPFTPSLYPPTPLP